jgi:hypothetical protein
LGLIAFHNKFELFVLDREPVVSSNGLWKHPATTPAVGPRCSPNPLVTWSSDPEDPLVSWSSDPQHPVIPWSTGGKQPLDPYTQTIVNAASKTATNAIEKTSSLGVGNEKKPQKRRHVWFF